MLSKLRRRAEDEQGFTLIELLVVILIIGILAAIAIPAFLNQRGKAYDASAKSQVKTAQTAMETYATDHNGDYSGATTLGALTAIEPTLADSGSSTLSAPIPNGTSGYTLVSTAASTGDKFTLISASGNVTRTCTAGTGGGNPGGCPTGGNW
jgi:type IV pilus assembly protein PilA